MDLVVLAAGMGSRFGGDKQIAEVDSEHNFILDYSVYDAKRAGFDRVVFIIKKENEETFREKVGKKLEGIIDVEYVFQSIDMTPNTDNIPDERVKPWGTAHALYCAKNVVGDKFAVINADDFYGAESFQLIADFFNEEHSDNEFISAGFLATNTLSEIGAVKRGIFTLDGTKAIGLEESLIMNEGDRMIATPLGKEEWRVISDNTIVSMTMFGFTRKLIDVLDEEYNKFFSQSKDILEKEEFLLPDVVNLMMLTNQAKLNVIITNSKWYGITYKDDLEKLKCAIERMKKEGKYPEFLYDNGITKE